MLSSIPLSSDCIIYLRNQIVARICCFLNLPRVQGALVIMQIHKKFLHWTIFAKENLLFLKSTHLMTDLQMVWTSKISF